MGNLADPSGRCALILAGGEGLRLRSLTRRLAGDERPKQFCAVVGTETLLDQTRRRVALTVSHERTTVVLTRAHQPFYAPLVGSTPSTRLVVQAKNVGTAPAILYGLLRTAATLEPTAPVAVFPSDHHVSDDQVFMAHVDSAFDAIATRPDLVVLLGIAADAAETEYGWIEPGEPLPGGLATLFRVRRFWEKPSLAVAQALLAKECLWNSFVMVAHIPVLVTMMCDAIPGLGDAFEPLPAVLGTPAEERVAQEVYARIPARDFSREVLAPRPPNLAVLPVRGVEWTDLGDPRRAVTVLARAPLGRERLGHVLAGLA
ncbi:MAG TPA: sugar phosphate nucleotidyltransferase [Methylomirabilota bacterium]|jgi:mannose-1-phosphate guanylyltransferase|nr:sugar phosphate nucleotidyltransferase [Methylomirabilota bacterium]